MKEKVFFLDYRPQDTILNVKQQFEAIEGTPAHQQQLYKRHVELEDTKTLDESGVKQGDFIYMAPKDRPIKT